MARAQTVERVAAALSGIQHAWQEPRDGMATLEVARDALRQTLVRLKRAGFDSPTLITAVDRLGREPRFELIHQLYSLAHGERVRVHTPLADGESAPTCVDLWPGAAYMERECFDLFGIRFDGHPELKRLYMPEAYIHHPLRKDFPHQGIEPDRLYREWDRRRRAAPRSGATSS
jgi:NADH:ubiquinone oxidoreductase subunit C